MDGVDATGNGYLGGMEDGVARCGDSSIRILIEGIERLGLTYLVPKEHPVMTRRSSFWHCAFALIFIPTISILFTTCAGGGGGAGGAVLSDTAPPTVLSATPSNGAIDIAVNAAVSVTFSEPMSAATITTTTFTVKTGSTAVPGTVSYSGATATFTPTDNWAYSTFYTATVTTGVKDLAGNVLANNFVWNFTTGTVPDTIPPTVSSTSPAGGAIDVAVNAAVSVTFSEPMSAATITTTTFTVKTGSTAIPGTVSYSGATATFTPTGNWAYSTSYTAAVTTGVKDLAGNALADNYGFSFTTSSSASPPGQIPTVTVRPIETSDILYNPGMGFADFHFGWGNPPPPSQYPPQTVAYFRWTWDELEPSEGQYNFGLVDSVIQQAKAKGETLAFRIMSVYEGSTPKWVRDKGIDSVTVGSDIFPDHNNSVFLDYHERLVKAFGNRYAGTPEIDHVDIGSVGCWGEWNTACCGSSEAVCTQYLPTDQNKIRITDWYFQYFTGTPLVMLHGGLVEYAASKGAGWRGDCFGDYGMFDLTWNHMEDAYEPTVQIPVVGNAWKAGPVQFEVCGVMQDWYDLGFDIDRILQKGLDWHMTVLNAKSSPVPASWRAKVDEFLKKLGYRFVLRELTHTTEARPGGSLTVRSLWENKGVAPIYHPWPLAYRLRSNADQVVATWKSAVDLMSWLPGTHEIEDVVAIPADVPAATYTLDAAILTEDAKSAHVELAIGGKRPDKWYPVSEVTIKN